MRIVIINGGYPAPVRAIGDPFVQQFVWAMARGGHDCTVINPTSLLDRRHGPLPEPHSTEDAGGGKIVHVHRPRFLSCSSRKLGWVHTGRWTNAAFTRCAVNCLRSIGKPDLVYGHFMYPAGYAAVCAGRSVGVPSVVGVGEGEFWTLEAVGECRAARELAAATAFLANSTCIAENLTRTLAISPEKIAVFPNGVALDRFCPADRDAQCRLLNIPADTFNIGFIGPPVVQKGYPQLREAVAGMAGISLILLGRDIAVADDPQVAYAGSVPHADVPRFLGACDIFVLPTAIEGSCNAVIEAMACGLPIVTSDGRHMDDIVDDDVAIRVDPADVGEIRTAILTLKNDPERRRKMSEACLKKARQFDINERARRVGAWMEELCHRYSCVVQPPQI